MSGRLHDAFDRSAEALARVREWLRRVMPRVAVAAVMLYVLRLLIGDTRLYENTPVGLVGPLTFLAVCATVVYYGLKILVRLKRLLLWRVRRRLIITYLFVGLTPVVLLLLLGALAATGGSSQAMVRIVSVEVGATERQTLEGARTLADAVLQLPTNANERTAQGWLDERAALLRAGLPGARVFVWRSGDEGQAQRLGEDAPPPLASASADEATRGVGFDNPDAREPLPAWLEGKQEWSGFAYLPPPADSRSAFGTPSVRALARRVAQGRAVAVLVTVPVSRVLVERLRETTGLVVRPYFVGVNSVDAEREGGNVEYNFGEGGSPARDRGGEPNTASVERKGRDRLIDFGHDQFGEAMPEVSLLNFPYPVIVPATNWETGGEAGRPSFFVDWSWATGVKQFWGDAALGQQWSWGLYYLAVVFLVLELLALFSAAWMTRAVTGTVHKLYRATESVKRGDFSHRIRTRSRDQLGELALAFNDMSSDIETLLTERVERERLEREIEIAAEVQTQLFPRSTPALRTVEVTGECRAARGVAGDYYDYIEVAPGLVAVTLGDVAGKGISAALVMSNLQAALRAQVAIISERLRLAGHGAASLAGGQAAALAATADAGLAMDMPCGVTGVDTYCAVVQMVESINEQLCHSTDTNRFATLFLALYDDRARELRYTNAGHNAPVLVRRDGTVERLTNGGTVVGAFSFVKFEEDRTTLGEGDLIIIFSDGITEACNPSGEEFGEQRLVEFAAARRDEITGNIRQAIFDEVDRWSGAIERGDDQTLVILKAVNREP
ncbi:MAG TPA: SpoIIE family protein phosphatase [Pyrinomonadaceae bacterium]|nr:SpoIIE family protein phosphatase [Pyrinomonadaceae bacterium]